ncbi:MAG: hypothetical protein V3U54_10005 [Thermodesulfobacteriota bacterium]
MSGFQDRTGCPNKITTIRQKFGECFDRMGGVDALLEWAEDNKSQFYNMFSKMATKEIKTEDKNKSQENFVKWIQAEEEKLRLEEGTPAKMIECSGDEISKEENNTT